MKDLINRILEEVGLESIRHEMEDGCIGNQKDLEEDELKQGKGA